MKVGFTGTRKGMSHLQITELSKLMSGCGAEEVHHGMCVGADAEFHDICKNIGMKIVGWPGYSKVKPKDRSFRANVVVDVEKPPMPFLDRNREIVKVCDVLIACPSSRETKGGTYFTMQHAVDNGVNAIVIYPDGEVVRHHGSKRADQELRDPQA